MPAFRNTVLGLQFWLSYQLQHLANVHNGVPGAAVMAQVGVSLPPMWDTQMKFLVAHGFDLAQL